MRYIVRYPFTRLAKFFHLESWARLCALCVLTGLVTGLGAVLFDRGLFYLNEYVLKEFLFKLRPGSLSDLGLLIAVPCLGLALAGIIAGRWAPEIRGGGTDAVIGAFHHGQGQIRPLVPWLKGLCSILTIGFGGSAGREGPATQIGAGLGSSLANRFQLSVKDRRILMLAGCAGGLGATLQAPLGGALFAAEMLYREPDFEHDAVIPGVISSVTAYSIFTAVLGHAPFLNLAFLEHPYDPRTQSSVKLLFPSEGGNTLGEFMHYAVLSLFCALVAYIFVKSLRFFRDVFYRAVPLSLSWKPGLGGLLLGGFIALVMLTGVALPEHLLGDGKDFLTRIINDAQDPARALGVDQTKLTISLLLLVIFSKIIATGLTVGSGASGGLLFPTLFIGAVTGASYVKFWHGVPLPNWLDWLHLTPGASAGMCMVAMGGIFCGCTKTPIASLVMICEMTGSYGLTVPLMLCCASTYLLTMSFTLDEAQVPGISDSPAHRGDFAKNILEDLTVRAALTDRVKPELIPATLPFNRVLERIKNSNATTFPIVDDQLCLVGIFSLSDIRQIMNERSVGNLVVAGDLGSTQVKTVEMDTNLSAALSMFTKHKVNVLPVVETPAEDSHRRSISSRKQIRPRGMVGTRRVVGMLTRQDLIDAYRRKMLELETHEERETAGGNLFGEAQVSPVEEEFTGIDKAEADKLTAMLTNPAKALDEAMDEAHAHPAYQDGSHDLPAQPSDEPAAMKVGADLWADPTESGSPANNPDLPEAELPEKVSEAPVAPVKIPAELNATNGAISSEFKPKPQEAVTGMSQITVPKPEVSNEVRP